MSANRFIVQLLPILAFLLVLPGLIALGFWQLDRAEQKRSLQASYDARMNDEPVAIGTELKKPEDLQFRRVAITGFYDNSRTVLVDNRVYKGVAGYYVITPLRLNRSETRVLVNRGWVPLGPDRATLPDVRSPATLQRIVGVATIPHDKVFRLAPAEPIGTKWQPVWQHMNMKRFTKAVNYPVQPVVVLLDPESRAGGFVRQWQRLDTGIAKHQGYAFQWFSLAAALAGIGLYFFFLRSKKDDNTKT
ncbi:MAG: SURF1 family protein [Acidiferrobacterales bacterium]